MPIQFTIGEGGTLIVAHGVGVLTDNDLLDYDRGLVENPDIQPTRRELIDFREVEDSQVTTEGLQTLAAYERTHAWRDQDVQVALVLSEELYVGMVEIYKGFIASRRLPIEFRVFLNMAEARDWLGLEPEAESRD